MFDDPFWTSAIPVVRVPTVGPHDPMWQVRPIDVDAALKPKDLRERLNEAMRSTLDPSPSPQDGVKYDTGKPQLGLIPRSALEAEAQVMGFGAAKYGRDNWRKGMDWSRLVDAALRHIYAFASGEDTDPESGVSHLGHARCCLAFLLEYQQTHPEKDDRFKNADFQTAQEGCAKSQKPFQGDDCHPNGQAI